MQSYYVRVWKFICICMVRLRSHVAAVLIARRKQLAKIIENDIIRSRRWWAIRDFIGDNQPNKSRRQTTVWRVTRRRQILSISGIGRSSSSQWKKRSWTLRVFFLHFQGVKKTRKWPHLIASSFREPGKRLEAGTPYPRNGKYLPSSSYKFGHPERYLLSCRTRTETSSKIVLASSLLLQGFRCQYGHPQTTKPTSQSQLFFR